MLPDTTGEIQRYTWLNTHAFHSDKCCTLSRPVRTCSCRCSRRPDWNSVVCSRNYTASVSVLVPVLAVSSPLRRFISCRTTISDPSSIRKKPMPVLIHVSIVVTVSSECHRAWSVWCESGRQRVEFRIVRRNGQRPLWTLACARIRVRPWRACE